ncbi:MAG: FGGY family carbohydrate kinase [Nitrososphaerota archaeon]
MSYFLGVDLGTMLIKAAIFDVNAELISLSSREINVEFPKPGWAEQDPDILWRITCDVIKNCLRKGGISSSEILGVGLTGQMHCTFLIDNKGQLSRNKAIIWLDSRSQNILSEYSETELVDTLYEITGWRLIPSMQLMHLIWLKRNEPEILKKAQVFLSCKDYIRYKLTGEPCTDITEASVTGLFNPIRKFWSEEVLQLTNLTDISNMLPEIKNPWETAGEVNAQASKETGLRVGTPVAVGAGDICSSALGAGAIEPGQLCMIIGTAGIYELVTNIPVMDPAKSYSIVCHAVPDSWLLGSFQMTAGASLRWFKDEFCYEEIVKAKKLGTEVYELLDKEAEQSPVGAKGVIFHPYLKGERSPFVKPAAKGLLFGLGLQTKKEDIIRAILEGVAYAAKDNMEVFKNRGIEIREIRLTGGATNSHIWCQIFADVLGMEVLVPRIRDSGILGSVIETSVATKLYKHISEAAKKFVEIERVFWPNLDNVKKYSSLFSLYRKLYKLLWDFYEEFDSILSIQ